MIDNITNNINTNNPLVNLELLKTEMTQIETGGSLHKTWLVHAHFDEVRPANEARS